MACRTKIDLESHHEIFQWAAHGIVAVVNVRGVSLEDRLPDILVCAREVASHGVLYGSYAALATVQLHLGHELRHLELGFLDTLRLED